jgi:hypothetical protein
VLPDHTPLTSHSVHAVPCLSRSRSWDGPFECHTLRTSEAVQVQVRPSISSPLFSLSLIASRAMPLIRLLGLFITPPTRARARTHTHTHTHTYPLALTRSCLHATGPMCGGSRDRCFFLSAPRSFDRDPPPPRDSGPRDRDYSGEGLLSDCHFPPLYLFSLCLPSFFRVPAATLSCNADSFRVRAPRDLTLRRRRWRLRWGRQTWPTTRSRCARPHPLLATCVCTSSAVGVVGNGVLTPYRYQH